MKMSAIARPNVEALHKELKPTTMAKTLHAPLMVLPVWIEHTTSPLPRECSTTELRQLSRVELGFVAKAFGKVLLAATHREHCKPP